MVAGPADPPLAEEQIRDVPGAGAGQAGRPHNLETDLRREILVSAAPEETWVALLEDEELVEVMFDRPDQDRLVGDILFR